MMGFRLLLPLLVYSVVLGQSGELGPIPYEIEGEVAADGAASGRLYGTKTYHAFSIDALAGAELDVSGPEGFALAVAGPEDRAGGYGVKPLADGEGRVRCVLPEDGRYLVMIGGQRGNYALEVSASPAADRRLRVASAAPDALSAAGVDPDELREEQRRFGLVRSLDALDAADAPLSLAWHRVFFSPKTTDEGWGWSARAREQGAFVREEDGDAVRWEPGNVAAPVVDLIRRAEERVSIAIYGISTHCEEGRALLAAAARGVQVEIFVDVASRGGGIPYSADAILELMDTPNITVRVPRRVSQVQHLKLGLVDGRHAFAGSANIGTKAKNKYTEDRFVFTDSPEAVAQLQRAWDFFWTEDSQPAEDVRDLLTGE